MVREGLDMTDHDNELLEAVLSELTVVKNMLENIMMAYDSASSA